MKEPILFIEGASGFVPKAIINKLEAGGFRVIRVQDDLDEISRHRHEGEIVLYYLPENGSRIASTIKYLADLCLDEHKTLCVVGDPSNIAKAKRAEGGDSVYSFYKRPVDIDLLIEDMCAISGIHDEYHRVKFVLIIDDDPVFLKIMDNWLKSFYKVDTVRSGTEALHYVACMRPDLILLDYEMPVLDGYQVFDQIRKNPLTEHIPIIFLTGKNDRESVMHILRHKPDGYLLKSMPKEELLDTLDRFFADTILTQKISRRP